MSKNITGLEPKVVWGYFAELNKIPRGSKKEEKAAEFVYKFGKSLGLETLKDEVGNVVIRKPGSKGRENHPVVILQAHVDMVPQKNNDTSFDFEKDAIKSYVDGDFVKAEGTTLGADNGIGVAAAMAVLSSADMAHPPVEALFTIDEETGMTGANFLKPEMLKGRILLNLDTEDDDELTIGCAGGIDVFATLNYKEEEKPADCSCKKIIVKGLKGGHSGVEINEGRANANKLLVRFLYKAYEKYGIRINYLTGGNMRNAIPREGETCLCVPNKNADAFANAFKKLADEIKFEYRTVEPDMHLELADAAACSGKVMAADAQVKFLEALYCCPNGVFRMSAEVAGLVETSSNMAIVNIASGKAEAAFLTRSSSDSSKMDMAFAQTAAFELAGGKVELRGGYPGWLPNPKSKTLEVMVEAYRDLFKEEPKVTAIHAGLECGIIGAKFPEGMDMASFGPNISHPHSPDEKVQVSSVQKFWKFLVEILNRL